MRPGLCRCAVVIALVACGGQQSSQGPGSTTPTSHALAVEVSGNGKVSSSPAGIDCGSTCSATFSQAVTLTATAGSGASFAGWGGACSGTGSCVVPMTADATVKATFQTTAPGMHALRVNLKGSGRVVSTPSGIDCGATCSAQFADGTSVALDVRPDAGWRFAAWSGACSGSQGCSITLTSDTSVGAAFQQAPPADECDGLLPASLPNPVVATLPESGCLGGTSDDGIGNYLLGYSRQLGDPSGHTFPGWQFFTIQDGKAVR